MIIDLRSKKQGGIARYESSVIPRIGETITDIRSKTEMIVVAVDHLIQETMGIYKQQLITVEVVHK